MIYRVLIIQVLDPYDSIKQKNIKTEMILSILSLIF